LIKTEEPAPRSDSDAVQAVENYLIMPVVGEKVVDIPPALLLMVQVLFGLLTGLLGLILAMPILVMVVVLTRHAYIHDALGEPPPDDEE